VGQLRVVQLHDRVAFVAGEFLGKAHGRHILAGPVGAARDGEQVGLPLGGEIGDAVGADHAHRQLVADVDVLPATLAVTEFMHHVDVVVLARFQFGQFVISPRGVVGRKSSSCLSGSKALH